MTLGTCHDVWLASQTYTMQGSAGASGVVHLAFDELLREADSLTAEGAARGEPVEISFAASMLEIYNEKVLDLSTAASSEPLDVRVGADGGVSVVNLRMQPVSSAAEVGNLLLSGAARRHTHGTLMNAASSRSHLVLTLHTTVRNVRDGTERRGKLHLVDLAGSERVGKSGVAGDQLREAQHINKSLSALEQVMLALQTRPGAAPGPAGGGGTVHIPYRNSKLTLLLSDALGAKGACAKTVMIMQVSPAAGSTAETLRTLKFGERCQSVCLGNVRRQQASARHAAAAKNAAAAEERATKLQSELLETRQLYHEADERARVTEGRIDTLSAKLAAAHAQLARAQAEGTLQLPSSRRDSAGSRNSTRSAHSRPQSEAVATPPQDEQMPPSSRPSRSSSSSRAAQERLPSTSLSFSAMTSPPLPVKAWEDPPSDAPRGSAHALSSSLSSSLPSSASRPSFIPSYRKSPRSSGGLRESNGVPSPRRSSAASLPSTAMFSPPTLDIAAAVAVAAAERAAADETGADLTDAPSMCDAAAVMGVVVEDQPQRAAAGRTSARSAQSNQDRENETPRTALPGGVKTGPSRVDSARSDASSKPEGAKPTTSRYSLRPKASRATTAAPGNAAVGARTSDRRPTTAPAAVVQARWR